MSLIECPECKKEISDKASSCPNCGCPITPELIEKEKRIKKMMMLRMERQNRKLAQENENRKKWKELGYDGISLDFVENSLSKEQIEKLFSDKILSKKIYSIFDETVSGCISSDKYYSTIFGKNAKEAGVRMVLDIPLRQETLLFTDNFLVVTYKEMTHFWKDGSYYSKYTYETIKDKLLVIPYFKILVNNFIADVWGEFSKNSWNLLAIPFFSGIPAKSSLHQVLCVSFIANWPKVKNASLGVDAVQLGFPLPASRISSLFSCARRINLSLNSNGLI